MRYLNTPILVVCAHLACAHQSTVTGNRPPVEYPPAEIVMKGQLCLPAPQTWTLTWISSPDQLQQFASRCSTNRIGPAQGEIPAIDFEQFGLLAVEMGRKPTTGYGFVTGKITATVKNNTATIKLEFFEPGPGTITAQMETGPWILVRLPVGPYLEIRVLDQNDRLLTRIDSSVK